MGHIFPTRLRALKLTHFRNYKTANARFDNQSIVFYGPNGAGKTNLLEAISFLSPGRGLRRANYSDVALAHAKGGNGAWALSCELDTEFGRADIGTGLSPGDQGFDGHRKIRIDRVTAKNAERLTEYARVLWLTPGMDGLFTGAAGERRRFLDRLVLAIDTTHGRRVNRFDTAIRNRNRILGDYTNSAWLDAAEAQVAELGIAITAARHETVALLLGAMAQSQVEMAEVEGGLPFPRALLAVEGGIDHLVAQLSATDAEDAYRLMLAKSRPRDRASGRTHDGPHRSEFVVRHAAKDMPARLCSTGEQKALLIGLVLAHARLVASMAHMAPIVLLDEVAAHLDEERRAALFNMLDTLGCQAFMTGTDRSLFASLQQRATFFHVENGTLQSD